ncbi:MAG: sigma-70 family RNA polymerase sigma factor [Opitutaceae bacterium]
MQDDSTLLRRYTEERSNEAFTELAKRHLDFVFSVALREVHGDFARAQDVTQEVFIALARKASLLHDRATLAGWLHISVRHAAAELKRGEQRRRTREQHAAAMLEQSRPLAAEEDWEQVKPVLNEVVNDLGEVDRDAVLLRFYQQLSLREIGASLRLTEDAAQKRVERALQRMRAALAKRGITSTSVALAALLQHHAVVAAPGGLLGVISQTAAIGAAATGAAAVFQFMSLTKIQLGIVGALVIAGAGTIGFQQYSGKNSREGTAASQVDRQESALVRPESSPAKSNLTAMGAQPSRVAQATEETPAPPAGTPSPKPTPPQPAAGGVTAAQIKRWLAAANDPAVMAGLAAEARALTLQRYSPFFIRSNMPPEKSEALMRLLDDKRQAAMDIAVVSLQRGVDPREDLDLFQVQVLAAKANIEEKIKSFMGEDGYAQFMAYNQEKNQENAFIRIERVVGGSAHTLTADQTTKLQQLLRKRSNGGITQKVISEAADFLSPMQLEALGEVLKAQVAVIDQRIEQALPPGGDEK